MGFLQVTGGLCTLRHLLTWDWAGLLGGGVTEVLGALPRDPSQTGAETQGQQGPGVQPLTLLAVPASGSLPPVTDHGLCAGLVVHPVAAAGHVWAVPTRGEWAGQAAPTTSDGPSVPHLPSPGEARPLQGPSSTHLPSLGLSARPPPADLTSSY